MTTTRVGTDPQRDGTRVENREPKKEKFAKLLAEKRLESDAARQFNGGSTAAPFVQAGMSGEAAVQGTTAPRDLEQLVNEIASYLASEASGTGHSVEIRFNARTIQGLRVQVKSEQGKVAIQLLAAAPNVARLLSTNLSSLRSALEGRGVRLTQLVVSVRAE